MSEAEEENCFPVGVNFDEDEETPAQESTITLGSNVYEYVRKDNTALHQAIAKNDQTLIDRLIDEYQKDFEKVQCHLENNYNCSSGDKFWLKKNILVACSEDQCKSATKLENRGVRNEKLREAVIVLLKVPTNGQEVAVLHPNEDNRIDVFNLVASLMKNGFLSWNSTGPEAKCDSFLEKAAFYGNKDVFNRFCGLGADINLPEHNPLHAACRSNRMDTVCWLLNDYGDRFDPTTRDREQYNALILAMQKRNGKMFDFLVERMVAFRYKHRGESESEAFNQIFRFENIDLSHLSIIYFVGSGNRSFQQVVEKHLIRYRFDVSYQWEGNTVLSDLLEKKMVPEYCFDEIRKNPKLLGLQLSSSWKIVHNMIEYGNIEFLQEMYDRYPEVKKYFEIEYGLSLLHHYFSELLGNKIAFICNHHIEFLKRDVEMLKTCVICSEDYPKCSGQRRCDLLLRYFPDFRDEIEKMRQQILVPNLSKQMQIAYDNLCRNSKTALTEGSSHDRSLGNIRGDNGNTLLHLAVEKGNLQMASHLIDTGFDFDTVDNDGNHAIHFVSSLEMLNLLIDRHPDAEDLVNRTNFTGHNVLHRVCSLWLEDQPWIQLIERIVDCGADVNQPANNGETVLFMTCNDNVFEILCKHGAKPDVTNKDGQTALYKYLSERNTYMGFKLLMKTHQLASFKDHAHMYLPLMTNLTRDFFNCSFQEFLEKNPETTQMLFDSVYQHSRDEASNLFNKVCRSSLNYCVEKFLDYDYDLDYNMQDEYGYTPIIGMLSYLEEDNSHLVRRLVKKGVDLKIHDSRGRNALLALSSSYNYNQWYTGGLDTARLLIDHGVHVNECDQDGNTALHHAFAGSEWELVKLLIESGGDLAVKNKAEQRPLEMASSVNQELFYFMV